VYAGLAPAASSNGTGIAHGRLARHFYSSGPPRAGPLMSSNIMEDSIFQLWCLDCPSSSSFCCPMQISLFPEVANEC
jgi:hypothetical protein